MVSDVKMLALVLERAKGEDWFKEAAKRIDAEQERDNRVVARMKDRAGEWAVGGPAVRRAKYDVLLREEREKEGC